jgi:HEAT repeat protein
MLLDDPVPWVRANAALSLAMVGDTQVSDALAARFAIEEDETTRGNLLIAMLACDPSKQSFVSSILANPEECEKVRVGACLAIERSVFERTLEDEDAALEMLDNLISSPDTSDDLQASIIWTIGKFERTPRITRILIDALESDYRWSVLYAVEALATQGSDTVIKALEAYRETHKDDEAIVERINIALEQVHLIDQQKAIADEVNEALDEALDSPISGEDENL